jgi:hypothetical protein
MEDVCPVCGSTETREPADDDRAFLITTSDAASAAVLSEFLNQKDIPFRMNTVSIGKYSVIRDFYVPYSRLEETEIEVGKLWKEEQPAGDAWSEGFGSDAFQAEEIDQMEWSDLDGMDLDGLKAYKEKITKTLKEIKAQEQLWKERANRLLDMREEAGNLIDELS